MLFVTMETQLRGGVRVLSANHSVGWLCKHPAGGSLGGDGAQLTERKT